jgi:hypothetical protein
MENAYLVSLAKISDLIENHNIANDIQINFKLKSVDFDNLLLEVKKHHNFNDFFNKTEITLKIGLVEFNISKNSV